MGVKNAWKFIKKFNPPSSTLSTLHEIQDDGTIIHVDLLGSFYGTFIKHFSPYKKDFKSNREACLSLLEELSLYFNKRKCILYLNGFDTPLDNCDSTAKTEQRKELNQQKIINLIKKLESSTHNIDFIKIKKIEWLLKKTVTVTKEMKQSFLQVSGEQGWNTVISPGRAVISIARVANGETVVVSNNSDMLFYSGITSIILLSQRKFYFYNIRDILDTLKISNAALTALAIVSGNDYDKNAIGFEINTNHKWVLGCKSYTLESKGTFITAKDYVDEYITYLKYICVLPPIENHYLDSYMIFVLLFETLNDADCSKEYNDFENVLQTWKLKTKNKSSTQHLANQKCKLTISLPFERA